MVCFNDFLIYFWAYLFCVCCCCCCCNFPTFWCFDGLLNQKFRKAVVL